jgi:Zn-finger nucleic acid-binding protein
MPSRRPKKPPIVQDLASPKNGALVPEGQRNCPICQTPMTTQRRNAETIDVCEEHGIWLDRFELERMFLRRMRRTGARIRRIRADAAAHRGTSAMLWGVLST